MPDPEVRKVIILGIISRLICMTLGVLSNRGSLLEGERATLVIKDPDAISVLDSFLVPMTQWDSLHFLNIATRGYDSVLPHAFFPGLPMVMRTLALLFPVDLMDPVRLMALCGLIFVQVAFVFACVGIYKLNKHFCESPKAAWRSTMFFVFPASSIFMSGIYTESVFAMFTFWGIYWLMCRDDYFRGCLLLGFASFFRSNGTLGIIYVVWYTLFGHRRGRRSMIPLIECILGCAWIMLPYILYSLWSRNMFCVPPGEIAKWCNDGTSIYAFVQKTFWRVYLFGQWHWNNLGNLLLMIPSTFVSFMGAFYFIQGFIREIRKNGESGYKKMILNFFKKIEIPFLAYMGILTFVTIFVAHVQIITRILSACPVYFWTIEKITRNIFEPGLTLNRYVGLIIFVAHLSYFVLGPIIHCNGWNWT